MGALRAFYQIAEKAGCEVVLHCGDLVDGVKTHQAQLRMFSSPEQLIKYAVEDYPDNLPTYWIAGNHETRMLREFEINLGREISKERSDMHYLGLNEARLNLHDQEIFLFHGDGGISAADLLTSGYNRALDKCTLPIRAVFCGHLHSYKYRQIDNTLALVVPSFQATAPFMKRVSVIGGLVMSLSPDRIATIDVQRFSEKVNDF
jgi:predicted phosphodiesterase